MGIVVVLKNNQIAILPDAAPGVWHRPGAVEIEVLTDGDLVDHLSSNFS